MNIDSPYCTTINNLFAQLMNPRWCLSGIADSFFKKEGYLSILHPPLRPVAAVEVAIPDGFGDVM